MYCLVASFDVSFSSKNTCACYLAIEAVKWCGGSQVVWGYPTTSLLGCGLNPVSLHVCLDKRYVHLITKHELLLRRTGMKATNTLEKEHVGY